MQKRVAEAFDANTEKRNSLINLAEHYGEFAKNYLSNARLYNAMANENCGDSQISKAIRGFILKQGSNKSMPIDYNDAGKDYVSKHLFGG